MSALAELDLLMARARSRVWALYGIVVGILALISAHVPATYTWSPRWFLTTFVWGCGCIVLLALGYFWVRARVATTRRLSQLVSEGLLRQATIGLTPVKLEIIPFGIEVDVDLVSGEHLAFGYWSHADAHALVALLRRSAAA